MLLYRDYFDYQWYGKGRYVLLVIGFTGPISGITRYDDLQLVNDHANYMKYQVCFVNIALHLYFLSVNGSMFTKSLFTL
jgi:hypothetical protein